MANFDRFTLTLGDPADGSDQWECERKSAMAVGDLPTAIPNANLADMAATSRVKGSSSAAATVIDLKVERGLSADTDGIGLSATADTHLFPQDQAGAIFAKSTGGTLTLDSWTYNSGTNDTGSPFYELTIGVTGGMTADTLDVWLPLPAKAHTRVGLAVNNSGWSIKTSKEADTFSSSAAQITQLAAAQKTGNATTSGVSTTADLTSAATTGLTLHNGAASPGTYITTTKSGYSTALVAGVQCFRLRFSSPAELLSRSATFRVAVDEDTHILWGH